MSKKIKSARAKKLGEHVNDQELIIIQHDGTKLYTTIEAVLRPTGSFNGFYINGYGQMSTIPITSAFGYYLSDTVKAYLESK